MAVDAYDVGAAELARIEGGSFSWGEANSPDLPLAVRKAGGGQL
jgi:hypothetical protein